MVPGTSDLFPEGKVWRIDGSVTLDTTYNYSGKGTLIIGGDLTLLNGAKVLPKNVDGEIDSLGIIVEGKVDFLGNNRVRAAMFVESRVNVISDNVVIEGSVVAKNFDVGVNRYGIEFIYDYNLENNVFIIGY